MTNALNLAALVLALAASVAAVALADRAAREPARAASAAAPVAGYRRVACLIAHLDQVALELADPDRLVAVSAFDHGAWSYRLGDRPRLAGLSELEAVLALHPDAVIASAFDVADPRAARLRAAGVAVLDAGESRGCASLLAGIALVGDAVGHRERASALARGFARRLAAVAARLPADRPRRRGIYLSLYADRLYGGTTGTSYHDVLAAAGIDDLAAGRWRDWPEYAREDLIALDPPLIVTKPGMGAVLRRLPGLERLAACRAVGGIIELDGALLDDAGLGMLDAAEALFDAAYPDLAPPP